METNDIRQRAFGDKAKLAKGSVGGFLSRAKTDPNATMTADAVGKLAVAWSISPAWLLLGVGQPHDAAGSAPSVPRLRDSPSWQGAVELVRGVPAWAIEVVGSWPAPPSDVPVSAGLVSDLASVVARFYPAPAVSPSASPAEPPRKQAKRGRAA